MKWNTALDEKINSLFNVGLQHALQQIFAVVQARYCLHLTAAEFICQVKNTHVHIKCKR